MCGSIWRPARRSWPSAPRSWPIPACLSALSQSWPAMAELILALDLPTRREALRLLDVLPALRWVKVGSILMTAEGPGLVRELVHRGLQVFLDLKWHHIPGPVAGPGAVARRLPVRMATVHSCG